MYSKHGPGTTGGAESSRMEREADTEAGRGQPQSLYH